MTRAVAVAALVCVFVAGLAGSLIVLHDPAPAPVVVPCGGGILGPHRPA